MMNFNRVILATITMTGFLLFSVGSFHNSFAQINQTSNNQTIDNKSSSPSSSSSDNPQTSRINGSSIATVNENAKLIQNP